MAASEALIQAIRARAQQGRRGLRRQPPAWLPPDGVERAYRSYLLDLVDAFRRRVDSILDPRLPEILDRARRNRPDGERVDSPASDLEELINLLRDAMDREVRGRRDRATEIAREVATFNRRQFQRIAQATLGVSVRLEEPYLQDQIEAFAEANAQLIRSIPQQEIDRIEGVAQRAIQSGRPYDQVAAEIFHRVDVSASRARLIARDQVQKLNSNLTELRQREVGVSRYRWVTSRDERVRSSHRSKHGNVYRWDDPPSDTGHPGSDVQCRCYAEPVLDDIFEEAGLAKAG